MFLIKDDISLYFDEVISNIESGMNKRNQNVSNKVQDSFSKEFEETDDLLTAKLLTSFYWIVPALETGRGPRKSNTKTNFEEKLKEWIEEKPITLKEGQTSQSLAQFWRWKINKEGNEQSNKFLKRPTGTLTDAINQKSLNELLAKIGSEASGTILEEIEKIKSN